MDDDSKPVSTWTRLTVPAGTDPLTLDDGSADGEKWKRILRPLIEAPGMKSCHCGKNLDREGEYMLVTAWQSYSDIITGQHIQQLNAARAQSPDALETWLIDFAGLPFYIPLAGYTVLTRVYFLPEAASSDKARRLTGMRSGFGRSGYAGPFRRGPSYGWRVPLPADAPFEYAGEPAAMKLITQFWASPEAEKAFKEGAGELVPNPRYTALQKWERDVKDAGALGWTAERFMFSRLPSILSDTGVTEC